MGRAFLRPPHRGTHSGAVGFVRASPSPMPWSRMGEVDVDHGTIDARSLALGRLIADRVRADPTLIEPARATIRRWRLTCSPGVRTTLDEWAAALDGPVDGVLHLLTDADQRATRLRQSNPFVGVISPTERNEILRRFLARP